MSEDLQVSEFLKKTREHKGDNFTYLINIIANMESVAHLATDAAGEDLARKLIMSIMNPLFSLAENLKFSQDDLVKQAMMLRVLAKQDLAELRKDL